METLGFFLMEGVERTEVAKFGEHNPWRIQQLAGT